MHYVYIVKCRDNSLYTGYTTDVSRRVWEHNHSSKGARYTRSRRPVTLVYSESYPTRSEAMKREYAIKQMSRSAKLDLIRRNYETNIRINHT